MGEHVLAVRQVAILSALCLSALTLVAQGNSGITGSRKPAESACGARNLRFEVQADAQQHPTPAPPEGKAMVYVIQKRDRDNMAVGIDERWIGANGPHTYFYFPVEKGSHQVCSWHTEHPVIDKPLIISFIAEAGKSYYFVQTRSRQHGAYRDAFVQADSEAARTLISEYGLATSEIVGAW